MMVLCYIADVSHNSTRGSGYLFPTFVVSDLLSQYILSSKNKCALLNFKYFSIQKTYQFAYFYTPIDDKSTRDYVVCEK